MADYKVTDAQLRAVAAAIRQKGGTQAALTFPAEFCSAIAAITGGTDTTDATATAADILSGKTAYAGGEKVTGTLVPTDTSDATATAADILSGKTAYAGGEKLTGTLVPDGYEMLEGDWTPEEATYDLFLENLPFMPAGAVVYHKSGHNSTYYVQDEKTMLFGAGTVGGNSNTGLSWERRLVGSPGLARVVLYVLWHEETLILTSEAMYNGPYHYVVWGKLAEEGGGS